MTRQEFEAYLEVLRREHTVRGYIPRFFVKKDEWDRLSADEYYRHQGVFRESQPTLARVLDNTRVVISGEPGLGKSVLARVAVLDVISQSDNTSLCVPVFVELRGYRGDLADLIAKSGFPVDLYAANEIDGIRIRRTYVLDGLDEVPLEQLETAIAEIEALEAGNARLILTCRQAFYSGHRHSFRRPPLEFHILGFDDEDIESFVKGEGLDPQAFLHEVSRLEFRQEISNPFTLRTLVAYFRQHQSLAHLRHENVAYVVDELIGSRNRFEPQRQRRGLKMLAMAMECSCRNELTLQEASRVLIEAMPIRAEEAQYLLDELVNSILLRTVNGYSFQMRSYGEYLAAEEMGEYVLEKIQELLFVEGTRIPNDSWMNTVGYLVEINKDARSYFAKRHPQWVLPASPVAFDQQERDSVVEQVLGELAQKGEFLPGHPTVNLRLLARFVSPDMVQKLIEATGSNEPVISGNAVILLGVCREGRVLDDALNIALDRTRHPYYRRCALSAVANLGDATLIPRILANLVNEDPLHLSMVDCIGALTDENTVQTVLDLLIHTDALVSSAFSRFRELQSRETLDSTLRYLELNPGAVAARRIDAYIGPVLELLPRYWDDAIAERVVEVVFALENAHVFEGTVEALRAIEVATRRCDPNGTVARHLLQRAIANGLEMVHVSQFVADILTPEVARWLVDQQNADNLKRMLAIRTREENRDILLPLSAELVREREEHFQQLRIREQARTAAVQASIESKQSSISSSRDFNSVVSSLSNLSEERWPQLQDEQKGWLQGEISRLFGQLDMPRVIVWNDDRSMTIPTVLPLLLRAVGHYELRLTDDTKLVQSLLGWDADVVIQYHKHYGLSAAAIAEFERLLGDSNLPLGALSHFLQFLEETSHNSAAVLTAIEGIVRSQRVQGYLRVRAIQLLDLKEAPNLLFEAIARLPEPEVSQCSFGVLIKRQHRPSIERRFAALMQNDAEIREGDTDFPDNSPLVWIADVRDDQYWGRLVALRERGLQLGLPRFVYHISNIMARNNLTRIADVIRAQLDVTPAAWRDSQVLIAAEYERNARIDAARRAPFDTVIRKLTQTSTLKKFKVYCEGPNDQPAWRAFVSKLSRASVLNILVDDVGGWANIENPNRDQLRLADGCYDLIVVMDGDRGRDMALAERPISAVGRNVERLLRAVGIDLRILERYGLENYFSRAALEAVVGGDHSAHFQLPVDGPVQGLVPGFSKAQNGAIAAAMSIQDLRGTDLETILLEIEHRANI